MKQADGYFDWNFKHSKGGICKIAERKIKKVGLTGNICFDNIAIEFEQYFKLVKPGITFRVGLFHAFICAN